MAKFVKGQSGNPNGRPKVVDELRARALKAVSEQVLDAWIEEIEPKPRIVGENPVTGEPIYENDRGKNWVKCSELLAAYGMGKPVQPLEHSGTDGAPMGLTVTFVKPDKA